MSSYIMMPENLRRFSEAVERIYCAKSHDTLGPQAMKGMSTLFNKALITYDHVNLETGETSSLPNRDPGVSRKWLLEAWGLYGPEHPCVDYMLGKKAGKVCSLSDFWDRRRLKSSAIYNELFRHLGVEYQIEIMLPHPEYALGFSVNYARRDFNENERLILELLSHHVFQSYKLISARKDLSDMLNTIAAEKAVTSVTDHEMDVFARFYPRQKQVLQRLLSGHSRKDIAGELGISLNTLSGYVKEIYRALKVRSQTELMAKFGCS